MSISTVLIAAIEGRNFNRQAGMKTYIQCRFNQEILTTDLVPLNASPIWDTELAWELDSKVLSFLKSQRIPIKVICYSIDARNKRETLGYVMLDLRTAPDEFPVPEKWYPLVTTKYTGSPFRPEIKIGFAVGPKEIFDEGNDTQGQQHQQQSKTITISSNSPLKPLSIPASDKQFSVPVQFVEDGYFQIGSGEGSYSLSIAISFAENLDLLINSASQLLGQTYINYKYFFELSFLVDTVQTEPFTSIQPPNFPAEKLSIQFKSDLTDLKYFLDELNEIVLNICQIGSFKRSRRKILGYVKLPLKELIKSATENSPVALSTNDDNKEDVPIILEQNFPVYNFKNQLLVTALDGKSPSVGISMQVSLEQNMQKIVMKSASSPKANIRRKEAISSQSSEKDQIIKDDEQHLEIGEKNIINENHEQQNLVQDIKKSKPELNYANTATTDKANKQSGNIDNDIIAISKSNQLNVNGSPSAMPSAESIFKALQAKNQASKQTISSKMDLQNVYTTDTKERWHEYRFSVDMKCIREVKINSGNIYVRYLYRAFGNQSPFISHPPVSVNKSLSDTQDFPFKNGFCANEFVMSNKQLVSILEAHPLQMEVWNKGEMSKDEFLGSCQLRLTHVLNMKKSVYVDQKYSKPIDIRTIQVSLPVISEQDSVVCTLDVILALEDFGIVKDLDGEDPVQASNIPEEMKLTSASNSIESIPFSKDIQDTEVPVTIKSSHQKMFDEREATSSVSIVDVNDTQANYFSKDEKTTPIGKNKIMNQIKTDVKKLEEPKDPLSSLHETLEYKTVLDLELWKRQEKARFDQELKEKEALVMQELAQVYKKRDAERQQELLTKIEELDKLQQHVSKITQVLDEREHQIAMKHSDFDRHKQDLDRQYKQLMDDVRDSNKKLQEEYSHKMAIEKQKRQDAEKARIVDQQEKESLLSKIKSLEKELQETKSSEVLINNVQLKSDLLKLQEEKERLEKLISQLKTRKENYKLNYINVLKKFKSLRKDISTSQFVEESTNSVAAAALRELKPGSFSNNNNADNNDHINKNSIQHKAKQEFLEMNKDKKLLHSIQMELNELRQSVLPPPTHFSPVKNQQKSQTKSSKNHSITNKNNSSPIRRPILEPPSEPVLNLENIDPMQLTEIERLIKERDGMISAGVYTYEDRVIKDLNIRIRELLTNNIH